MEASICIWVSLKRRSSSWSEVIVFMLSADSFAAFADALAAKADIPAATAVHTLATAKMIVIGSTRHQAHRCAHLVGLSPIMGSS